MDTPLASEKAVIGNVDGNFWVYDSETGFDLTHPATPIDPLIDSAITLQTTTSAVHIDPRKSALVIIDMQNFFLSPALGRSPESKGLKAQVQLLEYAIPAARKADIQIVWLNWGLSEADLKAMPPAVYRVFGFSSVPSAEFQKLHADPASAADDQSTSTPNSTAVDIGKNPRMYRGLGRPLGDVTLTDGSVVSAGRMLMRREWNVELPSLLLESFETSLQSPKPDVRLNKSRMSGLHVPGSPAGLYFQNHGIQTLLFAGVNTDQCVNSTLMDAFCQGYDCIMLADGCATSSPAGAQECVEHNAKATTGFMISCQDFSHSIDECLRKKDQRS